VKNGNLLKKLGILVLILGIAGGAVAWYLYGKIFKPNVEIEPNKTAYLYIPKGATIQEVYDSLNTLGVIKDFVFFKQVAKQKNLGNNIYPGRYKLLDGMSNNTLVNKLRAGKHNPVNLTFNYIRTLDQLAGRVSKYINVDSITLYEQLVTPMNQEKYGFTKETYSGMFLPNTYRFNWSSDEKDFTDRMHKEYQKFWKSRQGKAEAINLTPNEVTTLASIVQSETAKGEERKRIAGVYMNRLEKGIPLEADPTLIFAMGDFSIRRVLNKHKEIDSPYNTYKNQGLPPGPINLPEVSYIDAVLDYENHDYIFFCAKEDFSGYSNFAKTYSQHLKNAKRYHQAMNERKIFK